MAAKKKSFVICIDNEGFPASLEVRKIYRVVPDEAAEKAGQFRVVDESGEDYLYPRARVVPVGVPRPAEKAFDAK